MIIATRDLETPARALAIGAHPDDIEFGCGATLAKWAAAGCEITHMVCTDGSKGTWDASADLEALVLARQDEQRAASHALGGTGAVVFLNRVDGELQSDEAVRRDVVEWIRRVGPDVVLGHDPWKRYRLHPDHRHAGWLTVDGCVAARDPHFYLELGAHHRPHTLLLFEADEPDHAEDVTGHVEAKIAALEAHVSQLESTMGITSDDAEAGHTAFRRRVTDRLGTAGRAIGVAHAEVFKRMDLT